MNFLLVCNEICYYQCEIFNPNNKRNEHRFALSLQTAPFKTRESPGRAGFYLGPPILLMVSYEFLPADNKLRGDWKNFNI